jgi:glycosyltransferase involved in cell wall biosynthesis
MEAEGPRGALDRLAEADRRRDAQDWQGAAAEYAAWLALHPDDGAIAIQHGHCLKELGDLPGALAAYRRAERSRPRDADLQVQLGHVLKRAGEVAAARAAYGRALDLEPASEAAWKELAALLGQGADPMAGEEAEGALRLQGELLVTFDLADLLSWFATQRTPSGIQRVQIELISAALRPGAPAGRVSLASFNAATGTWRPLPRAIFQRLAALSRSGADPLDPAWQEAVGAAGAALAAAPDLPFAPGAWLVNLGTSWGLADYHLAIRAAKGLAQGEGAALRYATLVHDCGPLLVPEHCEPALVADFARWFAGLGAHADLLLATSSASAGEVAALRAALLPGLPEPPVAALPLDAAPPRPPAPASTHPAVAALEGRAYVLFVGTLESRKDHLFVLNAWLALLRAHGARVPRLVLVGRPGFQAAPVFALLRAAPALAEGVEVLSDVPDWALARLYAGALFTLYNSHHEGWGLPVTEALALGKVVVAPGHSGLLEAGRGLALHFAPQSEPALLAHLERLLFEPGALAAEEARIAAAAPLRSWAAVADQLLHRLADAPPSRPGLPPAAPLGLLQPLGVPAATRPSAPMALAELLRAGPFWHPPEPWGCWTRPGRALLRLIHAAAPGTALRLLVTLRAPSAGGRVLLRAGHADPLSLDLPPGGRATAALDLAAEGATLELAIEADPATAPGATPEDPLRQVGVGVVSVMLCARDDLAARLDYLERQRFVWPEPL